MSTSLLAHESTERNDGWDAGEEQEDGRRQTLHVDTVFDHAAVHPGIVAVLHVVEHTSEESEIYISVITPC